MIGNVVAGFLCIVGGVYAIFNMPIVEATWLLWFGYIGSVLLIILGIIILIASLRTTIM